MEAAEAKNQHLDSELENAQRQDMQNRSSFDGQVSALQEQLRGAQNKVTKLQEEVGHTAFLKEQAAKAAAASRALSNSSAELERLRRVTHTDTAANAALEHMRDWVLGTPDGDWTSMGIPSDGSYGIEEGLMYSYPVTCSGGEYSIVQDLEISAFSRERMDATAKELKEEQTAVAGLLD